MFGTKTGRAMKVEEAGDRFLNFQTEDTWLKLQPVLNGCLKGQALFTYSNT